MIFDFPGGMEERDSKFDVIICGTSMTNSILAGALARAGRKVLHLDKREFYGEDDATHDLSMFVDTLRTSQMEGGFVRSVVVKNEEAMSASKDQWRKFALGKTIR